jgi:predicted metal-dependent enzyme (double-stranded beta helix superfamily)
MLLLCWLPGQRTVIHDHGGSYGVVRILSGELSEVLFAREGDGRPLQRRLERRLTSDAVAIETVETIHRNENVATGPAISLHVYSPPLRVLNSFDEETGTRREVRVDESTPMAVGGNPRLVPVR